MSQKDDTLRFILITEFFILLKTMKRVLLRRLVILRVEETYAKIACDVSDLMSKNRFRLERL